MIVKSKSEGTWHFLSGPSPLLLSGVLQYPHPMESEEGFTQSFVSFRSHGLSQFLQPAFARTRTGILPLGARLARLGLGYVLPRQPA